MVLARAWERRAFIFSNILLVMLLETLSTPDKLEGGAENTVPHNSVDTHKQPKASGKVARYSRN